MGSNITIKKTMLYIYDSSLDKYTTVLINNTNL